LHRFQVFAVHLSWQWRGNGQAQRRNWFRDGIPTTCCWRRSETATNQDECDEQENDAPAHDMASTARKPMSCGPFYARGVEGTRARRRTSRYSASMSRDPTYLYGHANCGTTKSLYWLLISAGHAIPSTTVSSAKAQ